MIYEEQRKMMIDLIIENSGESEEQAIIEIDAFHEALLSIKHGTLGFKTDRAPYWINSVMLNDRRSTVVVAPNGEGKSRFYSWLILRAIILHPNWDFYTNLPILTFEFPELTEYALSNVYPVTSMSAMFIGIITSHRNGRIPAVLLDEMGSEITAYNWQSEGGQSWRILSQFQRHLRMRGPLLAYQILRSIPNYFKTGGLANDILTIKEHDGHRFVFSRKTRPRDLVIDGESVPYSSYGSLGFIVDVDMQHLYRRIATIDRNKMIEQLEKNLPSCLITSVASEGNENSSRSALERRNDEQNLKNEIIKEGLRLRSEGIRKNNEVAYMLMNQFPESLFINPRWVRDNVAKPPKKTQTHKT